MRKLWFEQALLPSGWAAHVQIEISDGLFTSVRGGRGADPDAERHKIAVPGVANLHSHAFQRAAAGRTSKRGPVGDSFWTWRAEIYRLAARLTPEAVGAIAALAYAEMLEAGFTQVGEFHYLHHAPDGSSYDDPAEMAERCFEAATATGIDITLLPVFYAHSNLGGVAPKPEQARFISSLDEYANLLTCCRNKAARHAGASVGVAPHSLRAVSPLELEAVVSMAEDGPIHMHIAEQPAEVSRCQEVLGGRPVEWLLNNLNVDRRWCLVHATHIVSTEVADLARSGAVVGLCPITEADLGDGVFPAAAYAAAGGSWGVGSDSNVMIDLAGELRLLEYGQRLVTGHRNVLAQSGRSSGASLFDAAYKGGQRALRRDDGGIAIGNPGTLLSLATGSPSFGGSESDDILDAWIYAARLSPVDCVWQRGQVVVQSGRHLNREMIEANYRKTLAELA